MIRKYLYNEFKLVAISELGEIKIYDDQNEFSLFKNVIFKANFKNKIKASILNKLKSELLLIENTGTFYRIPFSVYNKSGNSCLISKKIEKNKKIVDDSFLLGYTKLKTNVLNAKKIIPENDNLKFQLSPKSYIVTTLDTQRTIRFWDIEKEKILGNIKGYLYNPSNFRDIRENLLIIEEDDNIDIYDNKKHKRIITNLKDISIICIVDHHNKYFAIARKNGILEIWSHEGRN